eukprot:TRINITY_DN2995_c0_g1_i3.p1 TRINITY_DN2995_c0_g1~~TRINITY_DN2995_c0_g1_i3.p1  ORF type:complete len:350 (+),score=71.67 TRINITY_DN2995_c0_g1_i3:46-1095(+)
MGKHEAVLALRSLSWLLLLPLRCVAVARRDAAAECCRAVVVDKPDDDGGAAVRRVLLVERRLLRRVLNFVGVQHADNAELCSLSLVCKRWDSIIRTNVKDPMRPTASALLDRARLRRRAELLGTLLFWLMTATGAALLLLGRSWWFLFACDLAFLCAALWPVRRRQWFLPRVCLTEGLTTTMVSIKQCATLGEVLPWESWLAQLFHCAMVVALLSGLLPRRARCHPEDTGLWRACLALTLSCFLLCPACPPLLALVAQCCYLANAVVGLWPSLCSWLFPSFAPSITRRLGQRPARVLSAADLALAAMVAARVSSMAGDAITRTSLSACVALALTSAGTVGSIFVVLGAS